MAKEKSSKIRVGPQGRIVIPAHMRRELDISAGEVLLLTLEGDRMVLEKPGQVLVRLQDRFAHVPSDVSLVDELIAERREEAMKEARESDSV